MNKICFQIVLLSALFMFSMFAGEKGNVWTRAFVGQNGLAADQAFLKLFQMGRGSLEDLLDMSDLETPYSGVAMRGEYVADIRRSRASVGEAALYLVHAIFTEQLYRVSADSGATKVVHDPRLMDNDGNPASTEKMRLLAINYRKYLRDHRESVIFGSDTVIRESGLKWVSRSETQAFPEDARIRIEELRR